MQSEEYEKLIRSYSKCRGGADSHSDIHASKGMSLNNNSSASGRRSDSLSLKEKVKQIINSGTNTNDNGTNLQTHPESDKLKFNSDTESDSELTLRKLVLDFLAKACAALSGSKHGFRMKHLLEQQQAQNQASSPHLIQVIPKPKLFLGGETAWARRAEEPHDRDDDDYHCHSDGDPLNHNPDSDSGPGEIGHGPGEIGQEDSDVELDFGPAAKKRRVSGDKKKEKNNVNSDPPGPDAAPKFPSSGHSIGKFNQIQNQAESKKLNPLLPGSASDSVLPHLKFNQHSRSLSHNVTGSALSSLTKLSLSKISQGPNSAVLGLSQINASDQSLLRHLGAELGHCQSQKVKQTQPVTQNNIKIQTQKCYSE